MTLSVIIGTLSVPQEFRILRTRNLIHLDLWVKLSFPARRDHPRDTQNYIFTQLVQVENLFSRDRLQAVVVFYKVISGEAKNFKKDFSL